MTQDEVDERNSPRVSTHCLTLNRVGPYPPSPRKYPLDEELDLVLVPTTKYETFHKRKTDTRTPFLKLYTSVIEDSPST